MGIESINRDLFGVWWGSEGRNRGILAELSNCFGSDTCEFGVQFWVEYQISGLIPLKYAVFWEREDNNMRVLKNSVGTYQCHFS